MVETRSGIIPYNDEQRLKALHRYHILDTPPEKAFNNIVQVMAGAFEMPIALISLVDKDQVFFKGNFGMTGVKSTDRTVSLCSFAILSSEPTVLEHPLDEPCLLANPLVHGSFGLRFYAGAPLVTLDGFNIGSVCVLDKEERTFSARQQELLVKFADMAMHEIEVRQALLKQVEVEQELEKINEELQFVTDTMPQMVWATEANGYAYFFNRGWLEYTGLTLQENQGNGWTQALHPDDLDRTLDAWYYAVKTGTNYQVEYRVKQHDGAYRWFLVRGAPMKNDEGQIVKWYGTATDIHAQKVAEEALFQSKERFDLVAKATQDAIWDWDLRSDHIWWNEGFWNLFGYTEEDMESGVEAWYNRVHPDDRSRVVSSINKVIENGDTNWAAEYRFLKKDGSYALVFDRCYALHDEAGKAYRMIGSMQDITERKRLEEAAKESEARTRLALEAAQMGAYQINLDRHQIIHSPRTAEIYGLDPAQQYPYSVFANAMHPDDAKARESAYEAARRTGNLLYEARIFLPSGAMRWVRFNGARVIQDGSTYVFGTIMDITEIKETAKLLEQKIAERTAELKAANDQLQQFAYAASHDLQEPLRKINYFVDRLITGIGPLLTDDNKRFAERIQHTTNRMRNLIEDLLNYSNTSLGKTGFQEVDLNVIIREVLDNMEATIIEKKAVIDVADLPKVTGDPRQLKQMFQNLIGNSLKYHKPGITPHVQISYRQVAGAEAAVPLHQVYKDAVYHEINISDNGIGFGQENAQRIFGLFQRLHGKAEYEGTGIGLAIVQKVVENHKGFIKAEGRPGNGATFTVFLPAS